MNGLGYDLCYWVKQVNLKSLAKKKTSQMGGNLLKVYLLPMQLYNLIAMLKKLIVVLLIVVFLPIVNAFKSFRKEVLEKNQTRPVS